MANWKTRREMKRLNIDFFGMSEIKWRDEGELLATITELPTRETKTTV